MLYIWKCPFLGYKGEFFLSDIFTLYNVCMSSALVGFYQCLGEGYHLCIGGGVHFNGGFMTCVVVYRDLFGGLSSVPWRIFSALGVYGDLCGGVIRALNDVSLLEIVIILRTLS